MNSIIWDAICSLEPTVSGYRTEKDYRHERGTKRAIEMSFGGKNDGTYITVRWNAASDEQQSLLATHAVAVRAALKAIGIKEEYNSPNVRSAWVELHYDAASPTSVHACATRAVAVWHVLHAYRLALGDPEK